MTHLLYCLWHDVLVHPICGLLWCVRQWLPASGRAGDRLHYWSTEWPWRSGRQGP